MLEGCSSVRFPVVTMGVVYKCMGDGAMADVEGSMMEA